MPGGVGKRAARGVAKARWVAKKAARLFWGTMRDTMYKGPAPFEYGQRYVYIAGEKLRMDSRDSDGNLLLVDVFMSDEFICQKRGCATHACYFKCSAGHIFIRAHCHKHNTFKYKNDSICHKCNKKMPSLLENVPSS